MPPFTELYRVWLPRPATGDIRKLFYVASAMHTNFYENRDTAENVAGALDEIGRLLDKLEPLAATA